MYAKNLHQHLRKNLTKSIKIANKHYFSCKICDQDKASAPHICFKICCTGLTRWQNGKRKSMSLAVPMIWREPANYASHCYFYLAKVYGYSKRIMTRIVYPDCPSALRHVIISHENIPIPTLLPVSKRDNDSN